MAESMIERVAKAVRAEYDKGLAHTSSWDELDRRIARAAIEAMRNPNKRMRDAACAAMSPGKRPTDKRVSERAKHAIRYRAMIDAALTQQGEGDV